MVEPSATERAAAASPIDGAVPLLRPLGRCGHGGARASTFTTATSTPSRTSASDIGRNQVLAMIGPSGCGKSTFLRCLNRMNDTIAAARVDGVITLDGNDIYDRRQDVAQLRARVGIVFQKPTPFPHSIYANVAYGPRIHGLAKSRGDMDELVQTSLARAGLWEEVKDRLSTPAPACRAASSSACASRAPSR